jgi:hypothetical protein
MDHRYGHLFGSDNHGHVMDAIVGDIYNSPERASTVSVTEPRQNGPPPAQIARSAFATRPIGLDHLHRARDQDR